MARTMGRYGNNLEQLKREKSMLTISYEVTMTYFGGMILFYCSLNIMQVDSKY